MTGETPIRGGANAPSLRVRLGFRDGDRGTHTSRTIMSAEVQHLFAVTPGEASKADYWRSIIEGNALGKRTGSTRRLSAQRLAELYGLDPIRALGASKDLQLLLESAPSEPERK